MAGKKKKRASRWPASYEPEPAVEVAEPKRDGMAQAIEGVSAALQPYDVPTRKRILKAVAVLLK